MRNALFSFCFGFFDCVIEEEVDEDGVGVGVWVVFKNLPADQFHAPYAAGC